MRIGLLVILVGILYFFKNFGLIDDVSFSLLWPIITMLIGVSMVLRQDCGCEGWGCKWCKWCGGVNYRGMDSGVRNICACDCDTCKDCKELPLKRRK